MARTALLYDIHGNLQALEAVLEDARAAGASSFVLGGDYALFGPFPAETVELLRRELGDATWIRGNVDRWCGEPEAAPQDEVIRGAIETCRSELGPEVVGELASLAEAASRDGTRFCHASPLSDVRSFAPSASDEDQELLAGAGERRVVFGHTHIQFQREGPGGVALVNPGSVGQPWDGDPRAAYATLEDDGTIELRRVDYDHAAVADALLARFGSAVWTTRVAERIRHAEFR